MRYLGVRRGKLGTLPQRDSDDTRQGDTSTGWGRGWLLPEAAGQAGSWATGALGRPRCCLFSAWLLLKVGGGRLERPQEEPRGPLGFAEEQSRRESGGHLFPRLQAAGSRMGGGGASQQPLQGHPPGLTPPRVGSEACWWGAMWVEKEMGSKTLHRVSPITCWEFIVGHMRSGKEGQSPRVEGVSTAAAPFLPSPAGGHQHHL